MSRLLYPHDALGDRVYLDALRPLLLRAEGNRWLADRMRSGIHSLDGHANGDWLHAVPDRQIEALRRIQDDSFFHTVQNAVRGQLYEHRDVEKLSLRKRHIKDAVCAVSAALGNTLSVCKTYYIHTGLLEAYLDGQLPQLFQRDRPRRGKSLTSDEQILAHFLRRWPLQR